MKMRIQAKKKVAPCTPSILLCCVTRIASVKWPNCDKFKSLRFIPHSQSEHPIEIRAQIISSQRPIRAAQFAGNCKRSERPVPNVNCEYGFQLTDCMSARLVSACNVKCFDSHGAG